MSSLSYLYKSGDTETTVKKTYMVPLSELFLEEGYNVREINLAHVDEFRDAFIAGEFIPPLAVEVTETGVKIIDGHHRYLGALAANAAGTEILRLECKDFTGTAADKIAYMITSSQGMPLSPIERGAAYLRLVNQGWTNAEIAQKVKRSESDIIQHLQLMECSPYVQKLVREARINYALAIELQRKHGVRTDSAVAKMMEKAEGNGKKKITRATAEPQFSAKKARRFMQLFKDAEPLAFSTMKGDFIEYRLPVALHEEIKSLLVEYHGVWPVLSEPEEDEEEEQEEEGAENVSDN